MRTMAAILLVLFPLALFSEVIRKIETDTAKDRFVVYYQEGKEVARFFTCFMWREGGGTVFFFRKREEGY